MEEYYGLKQIAYHEEWNLIRDPRVKPNMYLVSTFGRVANAYTHQILNQYILNSGYYAVSLIRNKETEGAKYVTCLVHRLVAEAFVPNDNPYRNTVNHIDCNKLNNYIFNLEWMTNSENNLYKNQGRSGVNHYASKLSEEQVKLICEMLSRNELYRDIIIAIGLDPENGNNYDLIGNIKRGITYKDISKNYIFTRNTRLSKHSEEEVRKICECLEKGLTVDKAYTIITGEPYINSIQHREFYEFFRKIKARELCKEISNEYDF